MRITASTSREGLATVYVAEFEEGKLVEMVESLQPPLPREKKWVLIISTLFGCPVGCRMCDAGGNYRGKLSKEEMLAQIDFLVRKRYPEGDIPVEKFKIQFARMGEATLNPSVLDVLEELPTRYRAPGLIPCISTIAPSGTDSFFERLLRIKQTMYGNGRFQLQFSIHTTDSDERDLLMPVRKWNLAEIARYGVEFYRPSDRKIALNFALVRDTPVDAEILRAHFDPDRFLIKLTPLNPTYEATRNNLVSHIDPSWNESRCGTVSSLRAVGYEVLVSIGEIEENQIGSNCGQYLKRHLAATERLGGGYSYEVREHSAIET
jgi:23S rRNA (adenine2503-C2)-methyltransferase